MTPVRFRAASAVALLTTLVAILLRIETMRHEATGAASSCAIGRSKTFDCDAVQNSRYAKVLGISLSTLGAAAAATILVSLLASRRDRDFVVLAGGAAALSLLAVGYTAVVSWVILKKVCLYCAAMQLGFVGLAILLVPVAWRSRRPLPRRPLLSTGTTAGAILLLAISGDAYASQRAHLSSIFRGPGRAMRIDVSDDLLLGNPNTELSMVIFFDFGCSYCEGCYKKAAALVSKYPDSVHARFKHFPAEVDCNPSLARTEHSGACRAAVAGQAAHALGLDAEAMRLIFGHRNDGFSKLVINAVGQKLGVTREKWEELLASERAHAIVKRDVREGNELRLHRVPVPYVNGRLVEADRLVETVETLLGK